MRKEFLESLPLRIQFFEIVANFTFYNGVMLDFILHFNFGKKELIVLIIFVV